MNDYTRSDVDHIARQLERVSTLAGSRVFTSIEVLQDGGYFVIRAESHMGTTTLELRKAQKTVIVADH